MNKREAFKQGKINGYGIARENVHSLNHETYTDEDIDNFFSEMVEHECEVFRQYTPFEFFAGDINESRNPEILWDTYEDGVDAGIQKAIDEFKRGKL